MSSTEVTSSDKLVLYTGFFSSPPSRKIVILLDELNVPYEKKTVALQNGEHFQPWFKEISPRSKVPVLVTPHLPQPLLESGAIHDHIIQRYDTDHKFSFAPGTPEEALQTQWLYFAAATMNSNQVAAYFFRVQVKADWEYVELQLASERKRLELGDAESVWLVGGRYSVADISVWAQLAFVDVMATVEWKTWGFKEVERWYEAILSRDGVKKGQ
ncbi:thioredoxin-like protein [Ascobolus immersus RN42]|uniref:Thioredoxin-like protein n=1 Tax=Ascobolus immersus RN42 TaxID=1160509 RepID=A0A3N4HCR1_ASCIM|nr:thioredoxin-like protein [Ascobolus immersus RN42]